MKRLDAVLLLIGILCFVFTLFCHSRLKRHQLPDAPYGTRWTFAMLDEVGKRYLRWLLIAAALGGVAFAVLTVIG